MDHFFSAVFKYIDEVMSRKKWQQRLF